MWINRKYVEMLERELEYWRSRAETERRRADRLHDQLLVMHGQMPATETVLDEEREAANKERDRYAQEMAEIYLEETEERDDDLALPVDIQEAAASFAANLGRQV